MSDAQHPPRLCLVTGATGFVGQHLVHRLLTRPGVRVRILARSWDRARAALGPAIDKVEVVQGDLTDRATLKGVCQGVDTVFHCAIAVMGTFHSGPGAEGFDAVNHQGTLHLALEAIQSRVRRVVHVSSTAAMGTPAESVVDETTPCRPQSPYQKSKRAAEERLLELQRDAGLPVTIVRPCLVTGPGKDGGELLTLFKLCRQGRFPLFGRRVEVTKPLIDIEDLVSALELASERGEPGQIYLVHSDGGHTLERIIEVAGQIVGNPSPATRIPKAAAWAAAHVTSPVVRLVGRTPPLSPERLRLFLTDRRIDIRKARRELGFEPRVQDLHEMLGRTYLHYVRTGQL